MRNLIVSLPDHCLSSTSNTLMAIGAIVCGIQTTEAFIPLIFPEIDPSGQ